MNINDFAAHLDKAILARGLAYYQSGNVVSLEYDENDGWIADVEGSDDYTITVSLSDKGEILDTECDCPYDWGEYCKHQAAVFYALKSKLKSHKIQSAIKTEKKKSLTEVLNSLDKQTLLSIVLDFSGRDRRMKEELLLRYSEKTDTLKSARNVIRSTINPVTRRGFMEYADVSSATGGADTVLQMADDKIVSGDILTAVSLCVIVCSEMMALLDYCDDSNGYVGGTIGDAIGKISEAVSYVQKGDDQIFDIVFDHALDSMYNGWTDWRMELLSAIVSLCNNQMNRDKMEQFLSQRQNAENEGWSWEYENRQLQKLQYEIIKQFEGESAAVSYMEQHLDNSDFRRVIIQTAITDGQYEKALTLCLHGEQQDRQYAGLVKEWRDLRYTIYERTKDTPGEKTLGLELLLAGDFEYFPKLKSMYKSDEWSAVLQGILEKLESNDRRGIYVKILIREKLKLHLLDYCKKHASSILSHYQHLLPEYKEDVGALFLKLIKESAARADGRKAYQDVCGLIQHYKKASGKVAYIIRDELASTYAKRPAFLDELSKL